MPLDFSDADRFIGPGFDQTSPNIVMGGEDPELLAEYTRLRNTTFGVHLSNMEADEKFYRLDFAEDLIPKEWKARGFEATVPPTAYNAIEAASNHILTTPDILVPERPSDDMVREQAIAAVKASFLVFFWQQVFKQGDPLSHAKKDLIKYGKIVLKKVIDYEAIDPKQTIVGRRRFPWCVYQLPPSSVFEVGDPYNPIGVYEASKTTKGDAMRRYPDARGKWRTASTVREDEVRVLEYYERPSGTSQGRRVVWIEDERVLNKVNPYNWVIGYDDAGKEIYDGYVPYFIADSGWGDGDINAAPHERYVGMIRRIHSLLKTEARQLTAADAQLRIGTFPIIKLTGIEEDDEHPILLGPGAKVHVDEGQDISTIAWPQLDPALFAIIRNVHTYANEISSFQTLSGVPQSGVDSATEADQGFRAASAKVAGPLAGLKSVITRMSESALMDIEHNIETGVTVYGSSDGSLGAVTVQPQMIDGFYEVFVELKTSDQKALDAANAVRWANLTQTFNLPRVYGMKMAGIPNPQQKYLQRLEEMVVEDPRMHELRVARAMKAEGGVYGEMLEQAVIDAILAGGAPPDKADQPPGNSFPAMGLEPQPAGGPAQTTEQQAPRASGFNAAMMARPDLALRG